MKLQLGVPVAVFTLALLPAPAAPQAPARWHENDWIKFIDTAVLTTLGEAYSAAHGRFPLVDVYSGLSAAGSAVKPGLQSWLRSKMLGAQAEEDWTRHDRYHAFYVCLTYDTCEELRTLEEAEGAAAAEGPAPRTDSDLPYLEGTWICREECPAGGEGKMADIDQEGRQLVFTNEGGDVSNGHFTGPGGIVATDWGDLHGTVREENGRWVIEWDNDTVWVQR